MKCRYYKVNLKTGQVLTKIQGQSKNAVDLIRAPIFDRPTKEEEEKCEEGQEQACFPRFCGIETNCIVLVDFEKQEWRKLQDFKKDEFKSPWYSATFFLKDKWDFLVVGNEHSGDLRCFQIQNQYSESKEDECESPDN